MAISSGRHIRSSQLRATRLHHALLLAALPVVGCDSSGGTQGSRIGGSQQAQLPRLEVKLPPPPSFKKDHAPAKYPDDSLSVYGLRKDMKTYLDKPVRVKGFLLEVYECPPCPKGQQCKPCDMPHFWLSDRKNGQKDKALMVTDYPPKDEKTKKKTTFEVGVQYYVNGRFAKTSGTGFSSADGLIVFESATPVAAAGDETAPAK